MGLFEKKERVINLALQGGGAHGAFTWGVLDRLLEEPDIRVEAISGTSAGALNGAALASGFVRGGHEGARAALAGVWGAVGKSLPPELKSLHPMQMGLEMMEDLVGASTEQLSKIFSPTQLNPMNFDPLREIVEANIDFDAVRQPGGVQLFIAATEISTGIARIFETKDVTADAVLASACLPNIHRPVEIDGRYYWDGGYSANPDLASLIMKSRCRDTLLVQLEPMRMEKVPRSGREISDHMSWLTFSQPLRREIEEIIELQGVRVGYFAGDNARLARYKAHRFHHIDGSGHGMQLGADSKGRPDPKNLQFLFDAGRVEAHEWLATHGRKIGRRSSVKLSDLIV